MLSSLVWFQPRCSYPSNLVLGIMIATPLAASSARVVQGRRFGFKQNRRAVAARYKVETAPGLATAQLIDEDTVVALEAELQQGAGIAALRRFNAALRALPEAGWQARLTPVLAELCFNLESFNPAFAAVILRVQASIGSSDYLRRDAALKRLIVPLAGEYGMHNDEAQSKTHRELFDDWVQSLLGRTASSLIADEREPVAARAMFERMSADISAAGGAAACPLTAASYALGYNLAIEYLADYEKRWMLDSFRDMHGRYMAAQGVQPDWVFLEVHAEDEKEHACIGHEAVTSFVPAELKSTVARAMHDHDRDFAVFYNALADLLRAEAA
eukprot:jgi/Ulvmu1/5536/UM023_0072.1